VFWEILVDLWGFIPHNRNGLLHTIFTKKRWTPIGKTYHCEYTTTNATAYNNEIGKTVYATS
jgi:hypothetical protein